MMKLSLAPHHPPAPLRSAIFFFSAVHASTHIHDATTLRVMRAPLSFFHTNPVGRMLNRFSRDLGVIDDLLPFSESLPSSEHTQELYRLYVGNFNLSNQW